MAKRKSTIARSPAPHVPAIPEPPPLARAELLILLARLGDDIDALFEELGICREWSRNRDGTRRAPRPKETA
jgi:hypothetical protein